MSNQWPDGSGDYWGRPPGNGGYGRQPGTGGYGPPPGGPWSTGAQQGGFGPQDPYGAPGPYGGYPQPPPAKGSTIAALIVAIITVLLCCGIPTNIIGIVFASIALGNDRSVEDLERYTRYAWISNIVHVVIMVLVIVGYMALLIIPGLGN